MRNPGRRPAGAGLAVAALALAAAGCGHVLPLGPAPSPAPAPRHLAEAIVLQPVLGQASSLAGRCPASGPVKSPGGPVPTAAPAGPPVAVPATPAPAPSPLGQPLTITDAGVALFTFQGPNRRPSGYGLAINVRGAEATALTAISRKALDARSPLAIIVGGQTIAAPCVAGVFTSGQFLIPVPSRAQALQLQRQLLPSA